MPTPKCKVSQFYIEVLIVRADSQDYWVCCVQACDISGQGKQCGLLCCVRDNAGV